MEVSEKIISVGFAFSFPKMHGIWFTHMLEFAGFVCGGKYNQEKKLADPSRLQGV
jgi:hypothetical protein